MNKVYINTPLIYNDTIVSKSHNTKIYKDAVLLTPGTWSDMISNSEILYKDEILSKYARNWETNYLDLQHSHHPLDMVGTVRNQRWGYSDKIKKNAVLGDLYIDKTLHAGSDIVKLIDSGIVNQLSVEMTTEDYWDVKEKSRAVSEINFLGLAIIGGPDIPACKDTRIR